MPARSDLRAIDPSGPEILPRRWEFDHRPARSTLVHAIVDLLRAIAKISRACRKACAAFAYATMVPRCRASTRSDARGIVDMMRLGHFRPVHVKSKASQLLRTTLIARKKFVDHMLAIEDTIRGLMKVHGLKLGIVHRSRFAARVETLLADAPDLRTAIESLLEVRNMMRKQKAVLDRQLAQTARKDAVCKRLMTVSGVGLS
jgi:hypothetical protein